MLTRPLSSSRTLSCLVETSHSASFLQQSFSLLQGFDSVFGQTPAQFYCWARQVCWDLFPIARGLWFQIKNYLLEIYPGWGAKFLRHWHPAVFWHLSWNVGLSWNLCFTVFTVFRWSDLTNPWMLRSASDWLGNLSQVSLPHISFFTFSMC